MAHGFLDHDLLEAEILHAEAAVLLSGYTGMTHLVDPLNMSDVDPIPYISSCKGITVDLINSQSGT